MSDMYAEPRRNQGFQALSAREREVFNLAIRGLSNEAIAKRLHISIKTVETHRYRINVVIGVSSPQHLVLYAVRHSLLTSSNIDRFVTLDAGAKCA